MAIAAPYPIAGIEQTLLHLQYIAISFFGLQSRFQDGSEQIRWVHVPRRSSDSTNDSRGNGAAVRFQVHPCHILNTMVNSCPIEERPSLSPYVTGTAVPYWNEGIVLCVSSQ